MPTLSVLKPANLISTNSSIESLPTQMKDFQYLMADSSIQDEISNALQNVLKKYPALNGLLGLTMLHSHDDTHNSNFAPLGNKFAIEVNGHVTFETSIPNNAIPIAWGIGVDRGRKSACYAFCVPYTEDGGGHISGHPSD